MADDIDRANDVVAMMASAAVAEICRAAGRRDARPTGFCLYCGEPLPKGQRWCDADCRDDWEREYARRT